MRTPEERFGPPFDLILSASTLLEDGRSLGKSDDLIPVAAHLLSILGDAAIGRDAAASLNNDLHVLAELTDSGEPTMLATPAYLRFSCDCKRIAEHFARHLVAQVVPLWLTSPQDDHSVVHERGVANVRGLGGVDEFMIALQVDDEGQRLLGEYDDELAATFRARRPKPKQLPLALRRAETSFAERLRDAIGRASAKAVVIVNAYATNIDEETRKSIDHASIGTGAALAGASVSRLTEMESLLLGQRDDLKEQLVAAEAEAEAAFKSLQDAAARVRTGWIKGLKRPLATYTKAATDGFRLHFSLAITDAALAALATGRGSLQDLHIAINTERDNLLLIAQQCQQAVDDFETRGVTPVEEITDRPLCEVSDLHELYREACGTPWGTVTDEMIVEVNGRVGSKAAWLGSADADILRDVMAGTLPLFAKIAAMSADDVVRWKFRDNADLFLRDAEIVAPLLSRFDRARLPAGRDPREASIVIVGVPDRDRSVLFGTPHVQLVSTGDRTHIAYLSLCLGFPASALWQFPRYLAAHQEIARRGRVAHDIYPNFPHQLWRDWLAGPKASAARKARGGMRKKKGRR